MINIKYKEDYDLVDKYLCGDELAGRKLYSDVYLFLRKYIFHYTKTDNFTDDDREDILQITLERSIEKLDEFNGSSKFSTWIIGISNYIIKEKRKAIAKVNEKETEIDDEFDIIDNITLYNQDPLNIIITKEKITAYLEAFKQLPQDYKDIIILRDQNGVSRSAVAQIMDRSIDAVDKLYFRAIQSLKNNFKKIYK